MASHNARERRIQTSLTCRKCGSRAIVSDNDHNHSMAGRVDALKCLICGNRQEKGVPCRWPFFEGDPGSSLQEETRGGVESKSLNYGIDLAVAEEPRKRKNAPRKPVRKLPKEDFRFSTGRSYRFMPEETFSFMDELTRNGFRFERAAAIACDGQPALGRDPA